MKETSEVLGHVLDRLANHTNVAGLSAGEIAGISIGAVGVAVIAATIGIFCCRRMQRRASYTDLPGRIEDNATVDAEEESALTLTLRPAPTKE